MDKFKIVESYPPEWKRAIFEATVKLRAGEKSGALLATAQGYRDDGWAHCFEEAFDMFDEIILSGRQRSKHTKDEL